MSEGGTPRDERFATPRTFPSYSSKSDSKSNDEVWQTPRTALRRQGSINSNTSDFDYETPRVMAQDNDAWIPHTARSYTSNNDVPLTARSYTSNTELNQYSYAEEKPQSFRASSSNLPYIQQDEKQYYRGNQLAVHSEQDEYTLGVMEGIGEEDIEEVFSYARHGRIDDIESVLARGMPINIRDEWGSTLLIIACQNGNKRVAKLVLRRGADINARNHKGNTPLHYCYQYGYGDSLGQYLISKGADSTIRNNAGKLCWDGI